MTPPQPDGQRDRDRAAPRPDVDDPEVRLPGGRALEAEPAHDLVLRELDEALRLGPRDQRPRVDLEGEPVELLEPADVGDRLAGRAPLEIGPIAPRGVGPDRRLGMRDDGRPAGPDRLARAAARHRAAASRTRPRQPIGTLAEERPGRLDREPARRTRHVRRRRRRPPRRSAWSAMISASMRSSRSPSMTSGRLWTVLPIRWSVTRSCGKL